MQSNIVKGLDPEHSEIINYRDKFKSQSPTLRQIYNERLKYPGNAKPGTIGDWEKHFKKLGSWKDKRISEITRQQVLNKIDNLADQYTPEVADRVIKFISMLVNLAVNHPQPSYEQPTKNIVSQTLKHDKPFKVNGGKSRRISKMFPVHTWPAIWEAISELKDRVPNRANKSAPTLARTAHYYFKFCLLSGMRDGTVKTLEWHQINIEDGTISWVSESDVAKKKIDQQVFDLPVCNHLWEMLREMREIEIKQTGEEPQGYLFKSLGNGGFPHVATGMPHQWNLIRNHVGPAIAKMRVYDFRATFITIADELGIGTQLTKSLIDHKDNKSIVLEGYKDRGTPLKRRTVNQIAGHILGGCGEQEKKEQSESVPVSFAMFERVQQEAEKSGKTVDEVLERWAQVASMFDKVNAMK
ncbi:site-specific integrase [Marinobacter sp. LV10R510-11A]|uniref:site-specific integrase n=1 Tax=Marinobacter sp. LV10R510-11A TaxID=1415568 RepID=UPI001062B3F9|nr:site-specific integrase [Marinobacter sp. LV10R510-11A]